MIFIFSIIFIIICILNFVNLNILSSALTIAVSGCFFYKYVKKSNNYINPVSVFILGFLFSFGISLLQLTNLSEKNSIMFYIAIFVAIFSFVCGYDYVSFRNKEDIVFERKQFIYNEKIIHKVILFTIIISFVCFVIEVIILKFIPFFTINTPHAYSTFHIFILHYFTSLHIFVPSLALIYYYALKSHNDLTSKNKIKILLYILYSIIMSILMVSRGQVIQALSFLFITYIAISQNETKFDIKKIIVKYKKIIILCFLLLIALYIVITIKRAHSIDYLNDIFDMKVKLPLPITHLYMYICNGFYNLNHMINNITTFTFGKRMLVPFFTITFMKKFFPLVVLEPYILVKEELTNMTLIYDAYSDFGIIGIVLLMFFVGYLSFILEKKYFKSQNPFIIIIYMQIIYILLISFFQPFFSLTITYFNLLYGGLIFIISNIDKSKSLA